VGISIAQIFGKPEYFAESYDNFKSIVNGLTGSPYKFRYAEFSGSVVEMWCEMAGGVVTYRISGAGAEYTAFVNDKSNIDAQKPHQTPIGVVDASGNLVPLQLDANGRIPVSETFEPHADEHLQNGSDPLQVGVPVEISDFTNAEGTAIDYARRDHVHAHGNRGGGSLHALATSIEAGFMSAADKAKLDTLTKDHGSLDGLSDDDHPQYLLTDGSRNLGGNWNVDKHQLLNLVIHSSVTSPSSPANYQIFFYSTWGCYMIYDASRSKWLSIEIASYTFGRDVADGVYLNPAGIVRAAPDTGYAVLRNAAIVYVAAHIRAGQLSKTFRIRRNGTSSDLYVFTTNSAGLYLADDVNVDIDAGDVLEVFADPAGGAAYDVGIWVGVKWRLSA